MNKKLFLFLGLLIVSFFVFGYEIQELAPYSKQELKGNSDTASIVIESNMPKADVYLNSVYQGRTKLTVKNMLPGQYILEVKKTGYEAQKYFVTVKKGYSLFYRVDLSSVLESNKEDEETQEIILENSN